MDLRLNGISSKNSLLFLNLLRERNLQAKQNRFGPVLSNYITAREFDATFILLLSDLWGADLTQPANAPWPGDNGDWTMWDGYLNQLISDIKSHQIATKLVIDIWNEPEASAFWNRSQTQYLQMWARTYHTFR
jgi:hypothetical protein